MNPRKRSPCIIFLRGVHKKDYEEVEDQFDKKLLENTILSENVQYNKTYDQLPGLFTSLSSWPTSTNINCWTCEFTFSTRPIFIPLQIKKHSDKSWEIHTQGTFCTFSCAARHIIDYLDQSLFANLFNLYYIFNNRTVKYIYASPRRYCIKKYGGYMTENEYAEEIKRLELEIEKDQVDKNKNDDNYNDNDNDNDNEMSVWQLTSTITVP